MWGIVWIPLIGQVHSEQPTIHSAMEDCTRETCSEAGLLEKSPNRREFFGGLGTAAYVGLAGCLGHSTDEETLETVTDGLPKYAAVLTDRGADRVIVHTDYTQVGAITVFDDVLTSADHTAAVDSFDEVDSITKAILTLGSVGPALSIWGLEEQYRFFEDVSFGDNPDTDGNELMTVESVSMYEHLYLSGKGDETAIAQREDIETVGQHEGYTLFESKPKTTTGEPANTPMTFGFGPDHLVFPADSPASESPEQPDQGHDGERDVRTAIDHYRSEPTFQDESLGRLIELLGSGIYVVGSAIGDDEEPISPDAEEFDIDPEKLAKFSEMRANGRFIGAVIDTHDGGYVTRTGMHFDDEAVVPDEDEYAAVLADGATETNVVAEMDRLLVEAFWPKRTDTDDGEMA